MPKIGANAPASTPVRPVRLQGETVTVEDENEWRRAAELGLAVLARRGQPFTSMDLVKLVGPPPTASLLPALIRAAHLSDLIQKSDTAPVGTVWVGAHPEKTARQGAGRRRTDEARVSLELWEKARDRAAKEKVPTGEVLIRALRDYLKDS
ncbi:MAG: hypothetical protein LC796_00010 [Acidobacteria bacterium]|nr:hypothetical protein [Acidobacteriota bacterium]MCA1612401.1 hypothetical protein [Acidobacteriota bacterium]